MESIKHIDKLKDYIRKDVEVLLGALMANYDIYKNGEPVNKKVLYNKLLLDLSNIHSCNAVINGKLCKMKKVNNFDYCKKHLVNSTSFNSNFTLNTESKEINMCKISVSVQNDIDISKQDYTKLLIDDTFYYIDKDNKFIYNSKLEKVGYISNDEYILTDDPFILDVISFK